MANRRFATSILLLAVAVDVKTQFFDFFQPFPSYYITTQKPNIIQRPRPFETAYDVSNNNNVRNPITSIDDGRNEEKKSNRVTTRKNVQSTTKRNYNAYTENHRDNDLRSSVASVDVTKNNNNDNYNKLNNNFRNRETTRNVYFSTTNKPTTSHKTNYSNNKNNRNSNKQKSSYEPLSNEEISFNNNNNDRKKDKRRPVYEDQSSYNNNINGFRPNYETTKSPFVDNSNKYNIENDNNRRRVDTINYHNVNLETTKAPNFGYNQNNNRKPDYGNIYYTEKPSYQDYNPYTTQNPLNIRPGIVRPSVNDNLPPITNRPHTTPNYNKRPSYESTSSSTSSSEVKVISGPNEDHMSETQKRRYLELSEKMCDKYKSLQIDQLQAIPLLPSPDPVSVNVTKCLPVNIPLVVGGRVASIQEFPHMALLGWSKIEDGSYSWKCGGSLVSDQYVLTAAHCAYQDRDNTVVPGPPRVVQLGSSFLDDPGAIVIKVVAVIRHPKYALPKSYHDLSMLKLANKVTFSERIKPACLGAPPSPGKSIIATGWGRTEFGGEQSEELRSVSIKVWTMNDCRKVLGTSRKLPNGPLSDSQICAGETTGGKDTCQGDSGGPVQIQDGCSWRIVGVTSLGRSCGAPNTPGLYAVAQRIFVASVIFG